MPSTAPTQRIPATSRDDVSGLGELGPAGTLDPSSLAILGKTEGNGFVGYAAKREGGIRS